MFTYKILFTYLQAGRRVKDMDIAYGDNAQQAVDQIRNEYFGMEGLEIEVVFRECMSSWDLVDCWE